MFYVTFKYIVKFALILLCLLKLQSLTVPLYSDTLQTLFVVDLGFLVVKCLGLNLGLLRYYKFYFIQIVLAAYLHYDYIVCSLFALRLHNKYQLRNVNALLMLAGNNLELTKSAKSNRNFDYVDKVWVKIPTKLASLELAPDIFLPFHVIDRAVT